MLQNVDWILEEEPSSTRRPWRIRVYLTLVSSDEAVLQRSEPLAQAGREIYTFLLPHTWYLVHVGEAVGRKNLEGL